MKKTIFPLIFLLICAVMFSSCSNNGAQSEKIEPASEDEALEMMQGFWVLTGGDDEIYESIKNNGVAVNIEGELIDTYNAFETEIQNAEIVFTDEDEFMYTTGAQSTEVEVSFETRDGYELMIWEMDNSESYFEKMDENLFFLYEGFTLDGNRYAQTIYLDSELTDAELAWHISDIYWYELYFDYVINGETWTMDPHTIYLDLDRTGTYETDGKLQNITWEIYYGHLYVDYEGDASYYYPIDYAYDADTGYAYMYWYDQEEGYEGCAWVFYGYVEE